MEYFSEDFYSQMYPVIDVPNSLVCCHIFVVGAGIANLIDTDTCTYVAVFIWLVFTLLVGPPKSDRLKDRGQTKLLHFSLT